MKIVFLLRKTSISGGVRVVFEYANRLHDRGHEVYVVYPVWNRPIFNEKIGLASLARMYWSLKSISANLIKPNKVKWFPLRAKLLKVPTFNKKYIPKADVIVATRWETAYEIAQYPRDYGHKFYLIQHYETWCGPEEKVNLTYNLGLNNIVISNWIKNILEKKLGAKVEKVVTNGIDTSQFYIDRRDDSNAGKSEIRILMAYRNEEWKGAEDGIKAFEIAKKSCPNIKLVMFGPTPSIKIQEYVEFHKLPYGDELRKIYNSCDIFIFTSHYEGFALPPMEAMACGCAVITTNVGAVPDYTIKDKTALVAEPHEIDNIAQYIIRLVNNEAERKKIAENGFNYIQKFNWDKSTDDLEYVFKKHIYALQ